MPVGAAIGVSGLASAGAGIFGSMSASKTQADAQNAALAQQQAMFGQAKDALNPFITAGSTAAGTLGGLLNPGTSADVLKTLPGFQFQSQYGDISTQNALATQGLGGVPTKGGNPMSTGGGPLATALSQYNQGLAGTYFNNFTGALQNLTNTGANAAGTLASGAINSGANQAGNIVGAGNALASGTLGATNAAAGGLGSIGNASLISQLLQKSSGSAGGIYGLPNTMNIFGGYGGSP